MSWYYSENNQRVGPVDDAAFRALVAEGKIAADTLVWREGMPSGVPMNCAPPKVCSPMARAS